MDPPRRRPLQCLSLQAFYVQHYFREGSGRKLHSQTPLFPRGDNRQIFNNNSLDDDSIDFLLFSRSLKKNFFFFFVSVRFPLSLSLHIETGRNPTQPKNLLQPFYLEKDKTRFTRGTLPPRGSNSCDQFSSVRPSR